LDAYNVLCTIRNRPIQAARDLYAIAAQVEIEKNYFRASGLKSTSLIALLRLWLSLTNHRRDVLEKVQAIVFRNP